MAEIIDNLGREEIEDQIIIWREFTERQENDKFVLNSDKETVERLAKGVLTNEKNRKLKFCPCRMIMGDFELDKKLICPCNFKSQKTWKEKGECWCSLFIREK